MKTKNKIFLLLICSSCFVILTIYGAKKLKEENFDILVAEEVKEESTEVFATSVIYGKEIIEWLIDKDKADTTRNYNILFDERGNIIGTVYYKNGSIDRIEHLVDVDDEENNNDWVIPKIEWWIDTKIDTMRSFNIFFDERGDTIGIVYYRPENIRNSIENPIFDDEKLPDTFYIKTADIVYYEDISSMRENVLDSIESPKAYFIKANLGIMIAIEKENKYVTFYIFQEYFHDYTFERKNINNTGNEELVIRWYTQGSGRGYSFVFSNILVWDIDSYKCLWDFEDSHEDETWWVEYDSDTGDVVDSGENSECYKYNVELEKMQLTIQEDEDCSKVFGKKHIYKLTEFGFVLDRIE